MKSLRYSSLLAALAVVAAACGGGGEQAAPPPAPAGGESAAPESAAPESEAGGAQRNEGNGTLAIGTLLPETGSLAFLGPPEIAGVELAVEDINAAGGVLGQDVTLTTSDSGDTSTDIANQSTDRLLAEGVDAIIGAASSGVTLTVIDKITGAGVIQFSPANTAKTLTTYADDGLYFRTAPTDILQGQVLGETVVGDGASTVAIMALQDPYGEGLAEDTATAITNSGGEVVDTIIYDPNAQNYDAEVQRVAAANPDAIVLIGFDESARILQSMIEAGIGPDTKPIYGSDGNMANTLPEQVNPQDPSVLEGMKGTTPLPAENRGFSARLRQSNPEIDDDSYAAESYDATTLVALGAELAKTDNPTAISQQIVELTKGGEKCRSFEECLPLVRQGTDVDYDGVSGPLDFVDAGEPGAGTYGVLEFQANGDYEEIMNVPASL